MTRDLKQLRQLYKGHTRNDLILKVADLSDRLLNETTEERKMHQAQNESAREVIRQLNEKLIDMRTAEKLELEALRHQHNQLIAALYVMSQQVKPR